MLRNEIPPPFSLAAKPRTGSCLYGVLFSELRAIHVCHVITVSRIARNSAFCLLDVALSMQTSPVPWHAEMASNP
jgi:hypothetical protein